MNEERKGEDELFDFEFDELPGENAEKTDSVSNTPAPEDEIIELTNIVTEGDVEKGGKDSILEDFEKMLEEEHAEQKEPEEPLGISEEKIEAIITKVVGDVVERVTRETMTKVAEKVINEAIEDLKQNLELPPE
jgi:Glu-tRNA(Gln) amidotransferase subunit E-like FAD-binding protein